MCILYSGFQCSRKSVMSLIDLEPGLVLAVLLYLDSPAAFRSRRCSRAHANLFANGGLNLWRDLLKGISVSSGSHTTKGGIWLPMISEDVLSLYVKHCSAVKLATDLEFKDMTAVAGLQKASDVFDGIAAEDGVHGNGQQFKLGYVTRHGRPVCLKGHQLISPLLSYVGKSQKFLGSWVFNSESVRTLLSGNELGLVYSSSVEFCTTLSCHNGAGKVGEQLAFEVQLMLSRTAQERFVLSWRPVVTNASLLGKHRDSIDIHLHGHATVPFTFPLGYEGTLLPSSPTQTHINGEVPVELTLSKDDIIELVQHDCLNCALCIQLYQEDQPLPVSATKGSDADIQVYWPQCTEFYKGPSASPTTSVVTESQDSGTESRTTPFGGDDTDFLPRATNWLSETTLCWLCVGIFFVVHLSEESRLSVLFSNL
jgi:hypothetical protein